MKLIPVTIDFETYWSDTHTLSKMSPMAYVMHPDTQIISCAIKYAGAPTDVFFGEDSIHRHLHALDWDNKIALGHNMSGFDALIMAWRFNVKPAMWGCTAAMARPRYAKTCGVSLKALSRELGVGVKDQTALLNTKGRRLEQFTPAEIEAMKVYNREDVELCYRLFKALLPGTPIKELRLIDMTTRMLVQPRFELDVPLVQTALSIERSNKHRDLLELARMLKDDIDNGTEQIIDWDDEDAVAEFIRAELASAPRFSALLGSRGVPVPMKPSPTNPNKTVPALAKTDGAFLKLQEHPDPVVATAARTRLAVKSTLLETRLQAFLDTAAMCRGRLPVPLRYCGADTTGRWSGEHYNMQNLPRINPKNPRTADALRKSLRAPKGHLVVVADLSGIEMRVNHTLWQVDSTMELYAQDPQADLYRAFAAARYGITPEEVDKDQRQLAKVAQLGLGFGAGVATFQRVAKLMGGLDLDLLECEDIVGAWRKQYAAIVQGWRAFQDALPRIAEGVEVAIDPWGLCVAEHEAVRLPSGRRIHYPGLRRQRENGKTEWWYANGRHAARIYAGKGVENLVQALARDVLAGNALTVARETGFVPALTVHDELVYVVPAKSAESLLEFLQTTMRTPPAWWPQLVTWSEGSTGACYGDAK